MDSNAQNILIRARTQLLLDHPFFGIMAIKMELVEDCNTVAMWTDGRRIGYNPEWVVNSPLEDVKFVVAHEVMHVVCKHEARRGDRDHMGWNVAGDYIINAELIHAGHTMPEGMLYKEEHSGSDTDRVYDIEWAQKPKPQPSPGKQGDEGEPGDQEQDGEGQGSGGNEPQDDDESQGNASTGEGQDGEDGEGKPSPGPESIGEVRDATNPDGSAMSENERRAYEKEQEVTIIQSYNQAKKAGKIPGYVERLVQNIKEPKTDWRTILAEFVSKMAKNDYSWKRPNRRTMYQDMILPAIKGEEFGEFVAALDTSGSVSQGEIQALASELNGILEEWNQASVEVIYCDTRVRATETFEAEDCPIEMSPKGGGGTSFYPPFDYVRDNDLEPKVFIYLTDGYDDDWPDHTPEYPVIWLITTPEERRKFVPPFGEVIYIEV